MSPGRLWTAERTAWIFYRRIVREAPEYLKPGGWLCLEIGYDQGESLRSLLREAGFSSVEIIKDLAGLDRGSGRLPGAGARSEGVRKCLISWRIF